MTDSQRNLLILLAVAIAGVLFSGAFGVGTGVASLFLNLAFTIMIVAFLVIMYRKHSGTINTMPVVPRMVMQAAGAALIMAVATGMLPPFVFPLGWSNVYPLYFWGLILGCGFAMWWAWQQRTSRW